MKKPDGWKSIHLFVPPDFHKMLKVAVALKGTTIRSHVFGLIEADLDKLKVKKEAAKEM